MCVCVRLEHSWICRSTWGGWLEGNIKCTWQCSLSTAFICFHLLLKLLVSAARRDAEEVPRVAQGGLRCWFLRIGQFLWWSMDIYRHDVHGASRCGIPRVGMQRTTTDVQNHEIIIIAKYCKCNFVIFCMSYWHIIDICDMCQPIVRLSKAGRIRCHGPSFCLDP